MSLQLPADAVIQANVRAALEEDVGGGDLTAALIPADARAEAAVRCRDHAVLCGAAWFDAVFAQLDPHITVQWQAVDGDALQPDQVFCTLQGPARALLTGERAALNLLQTLSGTATVTRRYADAVAGTGTRVLDTRKTIPGLREAQKYAVRAGGGHNHRMGLYDGILIKENHIVAAGSIGAAVTQARKRASADPGLAVEVEVENLSQLDEALGAGADILLLDNFDLEGLRAAVNRTAGRAKLEASGNVTLDNIARIAATGVDFISVGALTKHVRAVDLSMRVRALL